MPLRRLPSFKPPLCQAKDEKWAKLAFDRRVKRESLIPNEADTGRVRVKSVE